MSASAMKPVVAAIVETTSYYASSDVEEDPNGRSATTSAGQYKKHNKNNKTNNHNNNNNSSSSSSNINNFYYKKYGFDAPKVAVDEAYNIVRHNKYLTRLAHENTALLDHSAAVQTLLRKSHSYSGTIQPKPTIIKQDSLNGRIATSLTADDIQHSTVNLDAVTYYLNAHAKQCYHNHQNIQGNSNNSKNNSNNSNSNSTSTSSSTSAVNGDDIKFSAVVVTDAVNSIEMDDQEEALLLPDATVSPLQRSSSKRSCMKPAMNTARSSMCYRLQAYITRNWYLNYLVPLSILLALMLAAYLTRDYAKSLLYWIERQNLWLIFIIYVLLFIIVSFPVVVGYFVLMITSGYLFGFFKGLLTVILGANVGIALAHVTIRALRHRIPLHKLIKNDTGRAILRVISGPRAFRVVLFTRLTPIPFGIQNAIFAVSSINPRTYHAATFIGLLPAQIINVYLGSTLRSMHEVLNSHGTAVTGYISFGVEVVCGVALMFWVVQKARKELSETLLNYSPEKKNFDIEV